MMMDNTKLFTLMIPSWYATPSQPQGGIFFKEQGEALSELCDVTMVLFEHFNFREIVSFLKNGGNGIREDNDNKIPHWYINIWTWFPHSDALRKNAIKGACNRLCHYLKKKNLKPHIIHAHSVYPAGMYAFLISKTLKIPYIITEHRTYIKDLLAPRTTLRDELLSVFESADTIIAVSEGLKAKLVETGIEDEIVVIPNIVDTDFFSPQEEARNTNEINLLFVGRISERKGVDILIRALDIVINKKQRNNISLKIVGEGPEYLVLTNLCKEFDLSEQCSFIKYVSKKELLNNLNTCDIFILPSRAENFGVVIIEAMSCGKPVIATKCGGPEYIITEESGIIVPPEDENALATAIIHMVDCYDDYSPDKIREIAIRNYSSKKISRAINDKYKEILGAD